MLLGLISGCLFQLRKHYFGDWEKHWQSLTSWRAALCCRWSKGQTWALEKPGLGYVFLPPPGVGGDVSAVTTSPEPQSPHPGHGDNNSTYLLNLLWQWRKSPTCWINVNSLHYRLISSLFVFSEVKERLHWFVGALWLQDNTINRKSIPGRSF